MRITFQSENLEMGNLQQVKQSNQEKAKSISVSGATFQLGGEQNMVAAQNAHDKGKTLTELQMEAGNIDVGVQQDYKTVLSHTMSEEDYAKIEEEGFDFGEMNPEEAVTIVDKIKAELARSGKQIAGYTDDLDMETLAAALGSAYLAQSVSDNMAQANVPMTPENIHQIATAWNMALQLQQPTEGVYLYMVNNSMDPEIGKFYLAQSSGALAGVNQPKFYAEEIKGYYAEGAAVVDAETLGEEIAKLLAREEIPVTDEMRQVAEGLLGAGIPVTAENIERMERLKQISFPLSQEQFAKAVSIALAEGKDAAYADLTVRESVYDKAIFVYEEYLQAYEAAGNDSVNEEDVPVWLRENPELIQTRKQLEEIRLRMTAEVNVKLLKSGFSIDTAPMEQLIMALRRAEAEVAGEYFPGDEAAVAKYQIYHETTAIVADMPTLPARTLDITFSTAETLEHFHARGSAFREEYRKAGESYEALMTVRRKDLGDSIRKAFSNVDDILTDNQLQLTDENRKAVRILGYNRMEITVENVARVADAQATVEHIVDKMTPASILKMIRDGINPLDSSFEELEQYFDAIPETYQEKADSYSRFLYGLEQNHEITETEKQSFIGVYRLLHQIEASDGAAVGALVNSRAELHFSNLLSAVRSGKCKHLDVTISDSFGATVEVLRSGESISDQIAKAFTDTTEQIMTSVSEEAGKEYLREELNQVRAAARTEAEAVSMLERAQLPLSADNLLAAETLRKGERCFYRELKKGREMTATKSLPNLVEDLNEKEQFTEAYHSLLEELTDTTEEITLQQAQTSVDVRALQMVHKQLGILAGLASSEEYVIPMELAGEVTSVHLTLRKGTEERGHIDIRVPMGENGEIQAQLMVQNGEIDGLFVGNTAEAVMKLQEVADIFFESTQQAGLQWKTGKPPVISAQSPTRMAGRVGIKEMFYEETMDGTVDVPSSERTENTELYRIAKMFLQAV